jgi:hypothetical protein
MESYSPRQLQLLRMASYLIQAADARLLDTLEVVLGALLNADRKAGSRLAVGPVASPEARPVP